MPQGSLTADSQQCRTQCLTLSPCLQGRKYSVLMTAFTAVPSVSCMQQLTLPSACRSTITAGRCTLRAGQLST